MAQTSEKPLTFDEGGVYRTRGGHRVVIEGIRSSDDAQREHSYPLYGIVIWGDESGDCFSESWTIEGKIYSDELARHRDDIIGYWES